MPQVDIPQDLFQQIQHVLPPSGTADEFVHQAVRDKIEWQKRREEFLRLTDLSRQALQEQGLTEDEILADFEAWRKSPVS
jgi:uncharacterized protein YjiS (DUF1127 family)